VNSSKPVQSVIPAFLPLGVKAAFPPVAVSLVDGVPDETAEEAADDPATGVVGATVDTGLAAVAVDADCIFAEAGEADEDCALWAEPLPPSRPARLHSPDRLSPCLRPARETD